MADMTNTVKMAMRFWTAVGATSGLMAGVLLGVVGTLLLRR